MTKPKKIVLWGCGDILSTSLEVFLAAKSNWEVVSISSEADQEALILAVESTQPDIVIICQECHSCSSYLPLKLLEDHPPIQVFLISLENNMVDVYSKQRVWVKQTSDLVTAIENEPHPHFFPVEGTSSLLIEGSNNSISAGGEKTI